MQLDTLKDVFGHDGRFLTVDVEVGRADAGAASELDSHWTTLRRGLSARVEDALLDRIGERVRENTRLAGEVRRTIVAALADEADGGRRSPAGGEVVLDDVHALRAWWPEICDVGELPDLSGWLRAEEGSVPFLLVRIDRIGADLEAYRAMSRPPAERDTVSGADHYITKVAAGDWAQKQFQQTAENRWRENAEEVAESVRTLARRHRPSLVLLAGDVRARGELAEALADAPATEAEVVHLESGGRAAGSSEKSLWSEVDVTLAAAEAHRYRDLADRLAEGASNGVAVSGLAPVLDALVGQRVDALLVDLEAVAGAEMRPADHPGIPLPERAAEQDRLPADRALVAAGALSGARLALLPGELMPAGPVAALLRWA